MGRAELDVEKIIRKIRIYTIQYLYTNFSIFGSNGMILWWMTSDKHFEINGGD